MTIKDLAQMVANDINNMSTTVTASVDVDGKLVLTSKRAGTQTALADANILADDSSVGQANFTGGETVDALILVGNEGDTYFQRWDSMKTYPQSDDDSNQVIDIASVMIESHINLDGRTDLDRGATRLARIDYANFGALNNVYSQADNFLAGMDMDDDLDLDSYRSSITWTLPKAAGAEIDEWTHITLASSLALDGDKGAVTALRRMQNSVIAFQEKGISEILFNSRTQLATTEGTPVEIANSGKVDGKRYISNKYGVTNKWSIQEGKSGIYFIDNINKIIGRLSGNGIESLSTKHGFDAWVRGHNNTKPWNPQEFNNFVTYYDKVHSDVYFVKPNDTDSPCLVYNEILDSFTGFFDYIKPTMMTNVEDRFISFKNHYIWLQNEGLYGTFFGTQYPFWVTWRVNPDGYSDKIWTGFEMRSDFITVLDSTGAQLSSVNEGTLINGDVNSTYDKDLSFDKLTVWNEYQTTGEQPIPLHLADDYGYEDKRKKFRIWRVDIPRAAQTADNPFGLDRIRNPWIYLKLKKMETNTGEWDKKLMQLHDVIVKYFSED